MPRNPLISRTGTAAIAALVVLGVGAPAAAAAAPGSPGIPGDRPIRVSNGDPFAGCTVGAAPNSVLYPGAEVEPDIAVDRSHPGRQVGVWQQDRWSDGGAHGIGVAFSSNGGRTFGETVMPVNECVPGGLAYERASDAWVSIGPDGTVYGSALAFDQTTPRNTVAATVSYNGGRSWQHTTALINDTQLEFFDDKNSVTADPVRVGTAYTVWDRLDGGPDGTLLLTGPTMMSVTHDFGRTWSPARVIVPTGQLQQTIGNIIVADPRTGVLYDVFRTTTYTDATATVVASSSFALVRSTDGGRSWSAPITIAKDTSVQDTDPNTGAVLRTGSGLPSVAIDRRTGRLYVAYAGSDFTGGAFDQVLLTSSRDGGRTWTAPVRVSGEPTAPAFTPTVAVDDDGHVGVTYYDLRTLRPGNTTTLPTTTWLTVVSPDGRRLVPERQIAPAFDLLAAPVAGGLFVGDYEGLAALGNTFSPLFVTTNSGQPDNRNDVFAGQFRALAGPASTGPASTGPVGPTAARAPASPGGAGTSSPLVRLRLTRH